MKDPTQTTPTLEHSAEFDYNGALVRSPRPTRFLEVAQIVWRDRRRVLRWSVAAAAIAVVIGLLVPNTYKSSVRLMPPDQNNNSNLSSLALAGASSRGATLPSVVADLMTGKNPSALFVGILESRTAQEGVVRECDLRSLYGYPWLHMRANAEVTRRRLAANTLIVEDRKSGIITVSVWDRDPARAAKMSKAYIKQLDNLVASLSTSAARREREFLEGRLKEVKQNLDVAVKALGEFSSKTSTLDPKEQARAMVEAAAILQGQLIAVEAQLKGLESIYTDSNVRVRSTRARIAELKKQLATMSGSISPPEAGSSSGGDMPYPSIRQLPLYGMTYADLYRRAKIEETVYEVLTQQYEMAKVQEAKEIPSVKVLDQAEVPELKDGPHRSLWLLTGAALGLLLGTGWAITRHRWTMAAADNPTKLFLMDVGQTIAAQRWWRSSELRLRNIAISSRDRFRRRGDQN